MQIVQEQKHASYALTQEATSYVQGGSPEAQVFAAVPQEGIAQQQIIVRQHCVHLCIACA